MPSWASTPTRTGADPASSARPTRTRPQRRRRVGRVDPTNPGGFSRGCAASTTAPAHRLGVRAPMPAPATGVFGRPRERRLRLVRERAQLIAAPTGHRHLRRHRTPPARRPRPEPNSASTALGAMGAQSYGTPRRPGHPQVHGRPARGSYGVFGYRRPERRHRRLRPRRERACTAQLHRPPGWVTPKRRRGPRARPTPSAGDVGPWRERRRERQRRRGEASNGTGGLRRVGHKRRPAMPASSAARST